MRNRQSHHRTMHLCIQTTFTAVCVLALYAAETIDDVEKLIKDKVAPERYNKRVRGVLDQTKPVIVDASLMLMAIERFSEVDESMDSMGVLFMSWVDERLKWDPVDYNGTSMMHVYQTDVWRPEVILSNPYKTVTLLGNDRTMLEVRSTGVVSWHAADIFKSTCAVNVESYPWDKQECDMNFVVWGYTSSTVRIRGVSNLIAGGSGSIMDLSRYRKNGQWRITSTDSREIDTVIVSEITFTVRLERRAVFDVIIVIIPTVTLSLLNLLAFFLPVQSGERMSYSITLLLSFTVLLTFLGNHLPKNADSMAAICYFISAVLVMSTVICACSVFSLALYYRSTESGSPPYWMRRMVQASGPKPTIDAKKYKIDDDVVAIGNSELDEVTKEYKQNDIGDGAVTTQDNESVTWPGVSNCFDMVSFVGMLLMLVLFVCIYLSYAF